MSVSLTTSIPVYNFSSGLEKIVFSTFDETELEVSLTRSDGTELLAETYVPDIDNNVVITELQSLIEPYLLDNVVDSFTIRATGGSGDSVARTFTVQFCRAEMPDDMSADDFMANHFLTTLRGEKVTDIGRAEYLHFVTSSEEYVRAYITYWDGAATSTDSVTLLHATDLNQILTVEVSPSLFARDGLQLLKYQIVAGDRRMDYVIDQLHPDVAPSLIFTNSFGVQETFYCTGTHTLDPDFDRAQALVNGKLVVYRVDETKVFKANTGHLTFAMAEFADDLFRSTEIYLLRGSERGKLVAITDCDAKRDNDFDSIPEFTFEYRYAQRNNNIMQFGAGRIFDNTFDDTFN